MARIRAWRRAGRGERSRGAPGEGDEEEPFQAEELLGFKDAKPPSQEQEAIHRRKVMRRARSKKQRPLLLAELERRYRDAP